MTNVKWKMENGRQNSRFFIRGSALLSSALLSSALLQVKRRSGQDQPSRQRRIKPPWSVQSASGRFGLGGLDFHLHRQFPAQRQIAALVVGDFRLFTRLFGLALLP